MQIYWENTYNEHHKETLINYSKQAVLQGKVNTFLYSCLSTTWHTGANKFFETVTKFKHLGTIEPKQNYNHEEILGR
jgi:hypothetical protein